MDKSEAKAVLAKELDAYRGLSYSELKQRIGQVDARTVTGPSEVEYQIEIEVFWDNAADKDLRVLASIDDGRFFSALAPVCDDFIVAPDRAVPIRR